MFEEIKCIFASYLEHLITFRECILYLLAIPSRVFEELKCFVTLTNWSDLDCLTLIAVAHPKFVPYGTHWSVLPYALYIRWWALKVCWLNATMSTMYADDVYLMMNYWEYDYPRKMNYWDHAYLRKGN